MKKLIVSTLLILALSTVLMADPPSCNPGDINGPPCVENSTSPSIITTILTFLGIKK